MTQPKPTKRKLVTPERIHAANALFHEHNLPFTKIKKELVMSEITLCKVVFHTRNQWNEYKKRLGI